MHHTMGRKAVFFYSTEPTPFVRLHIANPYIVLNTVKKDDWTGLSDYLLDYDFQVFLPQVM